jgi:hypothetical protein
MPDPRQKIYRGSDKGWAISLVRAAGSRLRLDRAGLTALELDDGLADIKAVFLFGGRLRQTATDKFHGLLSLLVGCGANLHGRQGYRLGYRETESVEVGEPARADELNDRQSGEERRLTCPSPSHAEACRLSSATSHPR